MKKSKLWIYVLIVAVIAVLLFSGVGKFLKDQFSMEATVDRVDNQVMITDEEYNVELKGMNVPDTNLQNLKGKNLFLNFWGTWCPPCIEEWPTIQKLYEDKNDKIDFVLIAMMDKEDKVKEFLKKNDYDVPVYIASSPLPQKFMVTIFPTTYIIAKDGRILKREEGAQDWDSQEMRSFLDQLAQ